MYRTTRASTRVVACGAALVFGAGVHLRAQAPDADATDAASALSAARKAQRTFERVRRNRLPVVYGGHPTCDVTIGRMCYWDDNRDPPLPPEPPRIAQERDRLLHALADAAARAPADDWIAGQRVRYQLEASRPADAIQVARACHGTRAWCAALRGLALHAHGNDVEANAAFDSVLAAMPERERCKWTDLSPWLDGDVAKRYHHLDCTARDSLNAQVWWLAQPLAIRPGLDARAEFLSRQTMIHLLEHADNPDGMPWGNDLASLLVRYGWPSSWALEDDGVPRIADPTGRPVIGHEPTPSFDVVPTSRAFEDPTTARVDDWPLTERRAVMRYAPVYVDTLTALTHQVTRFRRGDSMLVVAAYDLDANTAWTADTLRAGLVLASSPTAVVAARTATRATAHGAFAAIVPSRPLLMSLEVLAADARRAARTRYGIAPVPDSSPLSDILLLVPRDSLRGSLAELLPAARGSDTVTAGDTIGLYWECYAPITPVEPLTVRLRVVPAKRGWAHGVAHALHLASTPTPIALEWTDPGRPDGAIGRTLRLGLRDLPPGRYSVEISIEGRAVARATTSRAITVMSRHDRE